MLDEIVRRSEHIQGYNVVKKEEILDIARANERISVTNSFSCHLRSPGGIVHQSNLDVGVEGLRKSKKNPGFVKKPGFLGTLDVS